ncbi:MAG TPA: saccharopine dehydrogenase C-terminal domain-containing protein, partial [Chitinophagaceae bacterium]|nr:saccharopine dehydrogenase C-terminal domain-containing protein [Chitinophagaceae bacterium]
FSPVDVIEIYTRPSRVKENGFIVTKEALSERELMDFDGVGTLEAFNTDGLRSVLFTLPHIPNMKEKTLRYPGHIDLIIALQRSGFFSQETTNINGAPITPLQFTSSLLFKEWKLQPDEEELTVMKVIVKGTANGAPKTVEYNMLDRFDKTTQTSSMSRTTGYTCTAAVNAFAENLFSEKGVFPPELIGKHEAPFNYIMNYLAERNIQLKKNEY